MAEKITIEDIIDDLKFLFEKKEILAKDFNNFLKKLRSKEVKNYLESLSIGSKPEQALRESFFTFNAKFAQYLFHDVFPEVSQESGFIDYLIKAKREEISLEIKPLFNGIIKKDKAGTVFKKIKKVKLIPEDHKEQILKYLDGKSREFIVLTNLEDWYFFSRSYSFDRECTPFGSAKLFDLLEDFKLVDDFWYYLDNQEDLSIKEPLDKKFYVSLKNWVNQLNEVKFLTDDKKKTELIINLINKFIFIQSLDKFWVIKNNFIASEWLNIERKWSAKNKLRILIKFLEDINEYFYELYDTELFKEEKNGTNILDYLDKTQKNIDLFYKKFKLILGIDYGITTKGWIPGIIQYNFRRIDEDILGKSYETYLAEVNKEQGVYYTPKYITQYIVEKTVGIQFDNLLDNLSNYLDNNEFDKFSEVLDDFISIKVLDPACGSGSFLIKALKIIWIKYNKLNEILEKKYKKYGKFKGNIIRSEEIEGSFKKILYLRELLNFQDKRDLISKIIIRHIYGIDLDRNALEIAKLNIWLQAIKLTPNEFQFDKLPAETNHILPNLEMNLNNGNSLIGLPNDLTIEILITTSKKKLIKLFELRNLYLKSPTKDEFIRKINDIKIELRQKLTEKFKEYTKNINIPVEIIEKTIPFYWALEFWYLFFDDNIEIKKKQQQGFEIIIGNPPYFNIQTLANKQIEIQTFLKNSVYWKDFYSAEADIHYFFTKLGISLLKKEGLLGYIVSRYWLENDYAKNLRRYILSNVNIIEINDFRKIYIFEGVGIHTLIQIFKKFENIESHKVSFRLAINEKEGYEVLEKNYMELLQNTLNEDVWIFEDEVYLNIISKIKEKGTLLEDLTENVSKGMDTGLNEAFILDKQKTNKFNIEQELLKNVTKNSLIQKSLLIPSDLYLIYIPEEINLNQFPNTKRYLENFREDLLNRWEVRENNIPWYRISTPRSRALFDTFEEKIFSPYRSDSNRFAYDNHFTYGMTDTTIIFPLENISAKYLLAILNSKVLEFYILTTGKKKGNMIEYFAEPLKKIPIITDNIDQIPLIELEEEIIKLKKISYKFKEMWDYYSKKLRDKEIEFKKILLDDKFNRKTGELKKLWNIDVSVYPDEDMDIILRKFNSFKVVGNQKLNLIIYGIDDLGVMELFKLKAKTDELRDIIYLELLKSLNSRAKIQCLNDIFNKTKISIIKLDYWKNSENLLKNTKDMYKKWASQKNLKFLFNNIVEIDNNIQEIENSIDAIVFKLYEFDFKEVEFILDSLNVIGIIKNDIINKYNNL